MNGDGLFFRTYEKPEGLDGTDASRLIESTLRVYAALKGNGNGNGQPAQIVFESRVTPAIPLTGAGMTGLSGVLKPTVRVNGTVLYAPAGPAEAGVGALVFGVAVGALALLVWRAFR